MPSADSHTEQLLVRAGQGDVQARDRLLDRHRRRLCALVSMRMQAGLASRIDASDVVQESLADAFGRLPEYLQNRPLPFYLWLRELTLERLIDLHRRHVVAQKRSVRREEQQRALPDESMNELAHRLVSRGSSPSHRAQREELRWQVRQSLERLGERDREILVLRHLEQLSTREIATVLDISEAAVKVRHLRALQRLREKLGNCFMGQTQ